MLNHGTGINRVSSKLSLRTVITIYEKRSRAHGCAVTRVARQRSTVAPVVRLSNAQGLPANYRDVLRRGWRWWIRYWQLITRRGNVLYWSISCANRAARIRCAKSCLRTCTQVRTHTGIKYVFERRPVFVDKIAGSWMPEPDRARMEMSKFSARRKQSQRAPLTSGGISRSREFRRVDYIYCGRCADHHDNCNQ